MHGRPDPGAVALPNALSVEVPLAPIEEGVESDTPRMGAVEYGPVGSAEVGVWEITPGVVTDIEGDELFVVLSGAAVVENLDADADADAGANDGGAGALTLGPGSVVRFVAGTRTRWTVSETLRKVYVIA